MTLIGDVEPMIMRTWGGYRKLQGLGTVLTPETAATNDKRAKIARILCIMVFAHINYRAPST